MVIIVSNLICFHQRTLRHDLFTPPALGAAPTESKKFQVSIDLLGQYRRVAYSINSSVCLSLFCPEHNFKTIQGINIKLHGRYISLRRSAVHKSHNSEHHTFSYCSLLIIILEFFTQALSELSYNLLAMEYSFNYYRRQLPFQLT